MTEIKRTGRVKAKASIEEQLTDDELTEDS